MRHGCLPHSLTQRGRKPVEQAKEGPFKTEIQIVVVEDKLLDDEASHTHPRSSENTYVREELGGEDRRIDKGDLT